MRMNAKDFLKKLQPLIALVVMVVALSLLSDKFLTIANQRNILLQISVNLCLSIGMTFVILTGGIDLSVGAILALAGAVAAGLLKNGLTFKMFGVVLQFTPFGAIIAGILVGVSLGCFNGIAVTRFKLPPFVATLGMLSIARGLTMLWTGGFPVTDLGPKFGFLGAGFLLGVPMPIWISIALVAIFYVVSKNTLLGRYIYAVGGSEKATAFSGINVKRVKLWVYALAGALAAVAGLIVTARLDAADPKAGLGYELDSIAAVVIGGTSLSGGRGSIPGTVLGCLIIGVLNNGLFLLDVSPFWQQVIKGFVILAAVAADKLSAKQEP
ncbi:MAG TPA: ribose ABC transporter permease [Verrucomicrobiae bacterium]|nr:ribose ABC transporter permease [Verrucomicrobiae bacterium]